MRNGYSFIEIFIALCIFGILSTYSLSFLPFLHRKNQMEVIAHDIEQAIHLAKTEALVNAHTVTLSPLSENDDWSAGMLLFIDNDNHRDTSHSMLIREWHWPAQTINVTWHGFESTRYLRFTPGLLERGANGHFTIHDHQNHQVNLIVNRLARVIQKSTM